ncbi:hypothetical protein HYDPIDRAFT_157678 [Hydnomerulius pinastri MD-312]|uniref:Unplaced genomic scaffold scaffold_20, whole genome shotgun sequence n=1 Tax=Hydnomerulius pinastri MD-312 TaxID=994086 RepID=A0A0C9VX08_9AGAM|nr:hypothetical protein HYDPIDRAFT_157678 [Hydnomerulius pinastri MD-312]
MQQAEKFGQSLPDQVDRIASLFDAHLGLVTDVRDLYRDQAALEREYAAKLQLLAKKATEKKLKAAASLVAGDSPTKPCTDGTIRQNTLDHAYTQIIANMSNAAQDHINLAENIATQVTEPLGALERHNEDFKRKQMLFYQKLLSERDRFYQDRLKSKQKYDEDCAEVEVYRQKQGHAQHQDRHADRAARQYEQQRIDMLTSKNVYLVSIAVANRVKAKFYTEDVPNLEDTFQDLQTRLVKSCATILLQAQTIQLAHQEVLKDRLASATAAIDGVQPEKDLKIFVDLNLRAFSLPKDWVFEPCASHYDTDEVCVEPAPKVFLQNKLARSRTKLLELEPVLGTKRGEVEKYDSLVAAYSANHTLGNIEDAVNGYLDARQQAAFFSTSELVLRSEIDTIVAALGDDVGGSSPHAFKSSSFSIPTACGYCKASIWGLSKLGKTCKACGLSIHSKCELKVPAECTGIRGDHKVTEMVSRNASTISRSETTTSSIGDMGETPTPSSFVPTSTPHGETARPSARIIFDFSASSPFELSVSEGMLVEVLEEDDGSGWIKITDDHGGKGLVPASYLELLDENSLETSRSSESPQASGQFVRVLYEYHAQGPDELSITEGEMLELSSGSNGGQNYAEGWWEGYSNDGKKGIFPSNYVEIA